MAPRRAVPCMERLDKSVCLASADEPAVDGERRQECHAQVERPDQLRVLGLEGRYERLEAGTQHGLVAGLGGRLGPIGGSDVPLLDGVLEDPAGKLPAMRQRYGSISQIRTSAPSVASAVSVGLPAAVSRAESPAPSRPAPSRLAAPFATYT